MVHREVKSWSRQADRSAVYVFTVKGMSEELRIDGKEKTKFIIHPQCEMFTCLLLECRNIYLFVYYF